MAATNFTPISLYYSTTASAVPTAANLVPGELAINTNDGKLYYEDSSGVVQVLATKSTGSIGGSNTQVQFNNSGSLGGSSGLTWDGSFLTTSSIKNSALTSGRVTYAGASGLLSDSANFTYNGTALTLSASSAISAIFNRNTSSGATVQIQVVGGSVGTLGSDTGGNGVFDIAATSSMYLRATGASSIMAFSTNNAEVMRILANGNVGIGTSSPAFTLDVNGDAKVSNAVRYYVGATQYGVSFANAGAVGTEAYQGTYIYWGTGSGASATERMRIDSSGNVSVGGFAPSAWQTTSGSRAIQFTGSAVYGYRDTNLILTQNAFFDGGFKYYASSIAAGYYGIGSGVHAWYNAPSGTAGNAITFTQAMTLDASGRLLIGKTSSALGTIGAEIASGGFGQFTVTDDASLFTNRLGSDGDTIKFYRATSVVGSISVTATLTSYNVTSDQRLKTNVVDAPLGNIDGIKVRSFDWIADGSHQEYGMVAQELIEVAPYAVNKPENPDEMMGVDYSKLVPMMIKEIQDLKQRIATLENK